MNRFSLSVLLFLLIVSSSCRETKRPPEVDIVNTPAELNESSSENIQRTLSYASSNEGDIGDSTHLFTYEIVNAAYSKNEFKPFWSDSEQWLPLGDSLFQFIVESKLYGLFPEDYYGPKITSIREKINNDSMSRRNAALWAKADLLLTDAFLHIVKDLKVGRIPKDSITLRKDTLVNDDFYEQQLNILRKSNSVTKTLRPLEPRHQGYHLLKAGIKAFLDSASEGPSTRVPSSKEDSVNFRTLLQKRLVEVGYFSSDSIAADSIALAAAVKKFQKDHKLTVDGKAGETTLRVLNQTDQERFMLIAITLDKFKLLPEKMPDKYLWVNIPSFYMTLKEKDSVKLVSKIICGKPITRTPLLTSAISEIITYPQWTVPSSIIEKEILPAVKRDPGYLARKGFSLVDKDGNVIDPFTVEWTKYKKGIPYKVVQGSGDDNALGILKFNFPNKYAVYLHDTNQRSLFGRDMRSMSHGCVRVQEWEKLALYIIRNDSKDSSVVRAVEDSMNAWLARKEKHSIPIRNKLPLYIRYHSAEATPQGIRFYDDIYGEDKRIQAEWFTHKQGLGK